MDRPCAEHQVAAVVVAAAVDSRKAASPRRPPVPHVADAVLPGAAVAAPVVEPAVGWTGEVVAVVAAAAPPPSPPDAPEAAPAAGAAGLGDAVPTSAPRAEAKAEATVAAEGVTEARPPVPKGSTRSAKEPTTEVFDPEFKFLYDVPTRLLVHLPPPRLNITRLVFCRNYRRCMPTAVETVTGADPELAAKADTDGAAAAESPHPSPPPSSSSSSSSSLAPAPSLSCLMGASCKFVHADVEITTLVAHPIHVNYAWRKAELCTYDRLPVGYSLRVLSPNNALPVTDIPSELVLATRGSLAALSYLRQQEAAAKAAGGARPSSAAAAERSPGHPTAAGRRQDGAGGGGHDRPRSLSHCAHYFFNRLCKRGEWCNFIHRVYIDPCVEGDFKRAPGRSHQQQQQHQHQHQQQQQQQPRGSGGSTTTATCTAATATPTTAMPTTATHHKYHIGVSAASSGTNGGGFLLQRQQHQPYHALGHASPRSHTGDLCHGGTGGSAAPLHCHPPSGCDPAFLSSAMTSHPHGGVVTRAAATDHHAQSFHGGLYSSGYYEPFPGDPSATSRASGQMLGYGRPMMKHVPSEPTAAAGAQTVVLHQMAPPSFQAFAPPPPPPPLLSSRATASSAQAPRPEVSIHVPYALPPSESQPASQPGEPHPAQVAAEPTPSTPASGAPPSAHPGGVDGASIAPAVAPRGHFRGGTYPSPPLPSASASFAGSYPYLGAAALPYFSYMPGLPMYATMPVPFAPRFPCGMPPSQCHVEARRGCVSTPAARTLLSAPAPKPGKSSMVLATLPQVACGVGAAKTAWSLPAAATAAAAATTTAAATASSSSTTKNVTDSCPTSAMSSDSNESSASVVPIPGGTPRSSRTYCHNPYTVGPSVTFAA